jgi:hypothetical protein
MIVERKTHIPEDIDDDCVSRREVLMCLTGADLPDDAAKLISLFAKRIKKLPPVPPKKVCIAEVKVERDEVEQLIAEKVEEIKQAICSRESRRQ